MNNRWIILLLSAVYFPVAAETNVSARLSFDQVPRIISAQRKEAETFRKSYEAATNRFAELQARLNAASNRLAKVTVFLEEKKAAAKLQTTKAVYQAILDAMEK